MFVTLLTVLFIGLKLGGVIAWSWWWVLSPLWIAVGLGVGAQVLAWLSLLVAAAVVERRRRR